MNVISPLTLDCEKLVIVNDEAPLEPADAVPVPDSVKVLFTQYTGLTLVSQILRVHRPSTGVNINPSLLIEPLPTPSFVPAGFIVVNSTPLDGPMPVTVYLQLFPS